MLQGASLQNLTEWGRDSPFFGSVPRGVNVSGMLIPSNRVENIDILEFEDFSWILDRFGFPEGPLGS
jgi:hypothetical protein